MQICILYGSLQTFHASARNRCATQHPKDY